MKKELKIVVPNGYEIDKKNSTYEKIVFKKIDTKPKSWEEYCEQKIKNGEKGYFIRDLNCDVRETDWGSCETIDEWRNVLPSKEIAQYFIAMMQLISLRQDWIHKWSIDNGMIDDWQPDWNNFSDNWCIVNCSNKIIISPYCRVVRALSFPTKKMAEKFMKCFGDFLEIAKPLI